MKMRAEILWAVLLTLPFAATANPLRVQSGEHRSFTRFVVPWSANKEWVATRTENAATLTLQGHGEGFNLASAFSLIPRDRVSGLTSTSDQLVFEIGCDCDVAAFSSGNGYVVIDIADAGQSLVPPLKVSASDDSVVPAMAVATEVEAVDLPWINVTEAQPAEEDPALVVRRRALAAELQDPFAHSVVGQQHSTVLEKTRNRLAREIGTATTRGVLQPAGGGVAPFIQVDEESEPKSEATSELPQNPVAVPGNSTNLRITTSRDVPEEGHSGDALAVSGGMTCPPEEIAAIEDWGNDTSFSNQISTHRNNLYGEFDRIDPDALAGLARNYIHFGFGAEAIQIIQLDQTESLETQVLQGIAEIMERGQINRPHPLNALTDCDSSLALWAILSRERIPDLTMVNAPAALRALDRLPIHLREFLAPALSDRLLAFGDSANAGAALRAIERTANTLPPLGTLAQARIAMDSGDEEKAHEKLAKVIKANAAPSPEALLTLVQEKLAHDQPISFETATLVEAYAHELRSSPIGTELRRVQVLSLSKSGQFDKAFELLADYVRDDPSQRLIALRSAVFDELSKSGSDLEFLDHVFQLTDIQRQTFSPDAGLQISGRLLALGFPGAAQEFIAHVPDRPIDPVRQILAANIAVALGQPNQARAFLIGVEGNEADLIRGQASMLSGRADEAAEIFAAVEQTDTAIRAAWLADGWRDLTPVDTPIFGPVAALGAAPEIRPDISEGVLSRSEAALEESAEARSVLGMLLQAAPVQIENTTDPE